MIKNVKDFGATGDGTTDDTAAVQAALNAATHASPVYFPKGVYYIPVPLVVVNGKIFGDGIGQSSILRSKTRV